MTRWGRSPDGHLEVWFRTESGGVRHTTILFRPHDQGAEWIVGEREWSPFSTLLEQGRWIMTTVTRWLDSPGTV